MAEELVEKALQYKTLLPNKELVAYVRNYTLIKLPIGNKQLTFTPLPNGLIELFICLNGSSVRFDSNSKVQESTCFLKCLRDIEMVRKITISSTSGIFQMLLVSFTFKGAFNFFNYKFHKYFNQVIDLPNWIDTKDNLSFKEKGKYGLFVQKVNSLLERAKANKDCSFASVLDQAHDLLVLSKGRIGVYELALMLNKSYESVYRLFHNKLGVCPKSYLNIVRFKKVCQYLSNNPKPNWQKIVFEFGYYDQAHFINEFTRIMHKPPKEFLRYTSGGFYKNMAFKEGLL